MLNAIVTILDRFLDVFFMFCDLKREKENPKQNILFPK
jgi:hypothetical protein